VAHDPAPARAQHEHDPIGVELLAVRAGRAVVEPCDERRRPRRAGHKDVEQLALQAGGAEVLQEALDRRLATVLARPAMVALVEDEDGVVCVAAEQRARVAGVELGEVPRELCPDGADEEGAGAQCPARPRRPGRVRS